MATDLNAQVQGIKDEYKYGFRDADANYSFKSQKGLTTADRRADLRDEGRARLDARHPAEGPGGLLAEADPDLGRRPRRAELQRHLLLHEGRRPAGQDAGTTCRPTSSAPSTSSASPRPRRSSWPASAPSTSRRSSTTASARTSQKQGVIFTDTDSALREYPDLVREYFGTIIPIDDNKFAALNSAVWSGGSFVYIPAGVKVDIPLQAYFRINAENMGQFERTLIIVEEGAQVHYVEGCTAPIYTTESLHSAVVEIIVKKGGRCRYTTIQNWANNIYNLVTKRAVAYEDALMEWVDGNLGSRLTMKYPAVHMRRQGGPRRDPLDRLRRQGPAPGRRRQGRPRGALHVQPDHLQVDQQERRPVQLPRPAEGRSTAPRARSRTSSATP